MNSLHLFRQIIATGMLAALVTGCSTSHGKEKPSPDGEAHPHVTVSSAAVCGKLLDKTGSSALSRLTASTRVLPQRNNRPDGKRRVAASMRSASPAEVSGKRKKLQSICAFTAPPTSDRTLTRDVSIKYGWSTRPKQTDNKYSYFSAGSALVDVNFKDRMEPYNIYFTCETSSNRSGIVQGASRGGWFLSNAEQTSRDYAQILLTSAEKMSDSLGCTNKLDLSPTSTLKGFGGHFVDTPANIALPSPPKSGPIEP